MTSRLTETFSGARLIKAFRLEAYAVDRLDTRTSSRCSASA